MSHLVENLKIACATQRSISHLCRAIDINRQQFNRYINGQTKPSAHNLARIAKHFDLDAADFLLAPRQFREHLRRPALGLNETSELLKAFPGNLTALRRHIGYYQTYHRSPSWPGMVVCSCSRLTERGGLVHVKSMERLRDPGNGIQQFSKYVGLAAFYRNRIFITERVVGPNSMLSQTILLPFDEYQRVYLRGTTMGISWRKENLPYASRMIWRHVGAEPDFRELLARCGPLPLSSRNLPPTVRSFLADPSAEVYAMPTEY
ncbi:XRE family transcriptional regulator [Rhizobium ruizarguesonis]|uniref:helix-turn-helix domain-containing protein n=1 Tax=Rhizobium TaxID=379 RepID=UPI00102F447C|nr:MULTISPECIES: helix-turn-helix transcriptional regulator [Rhizobium]NDK53379.1 helix-turn-helix transcriptional regulator [Rhizobium laguerreae]TAW47882.1 XRE family transcriptional regulator [Rhizobium ruizarguesonis]